jgi:predicted MFS family arabinose efflux permease
MTPPPFLRLYICFAAAYLLSYVFRNANAIISPELTGSLGISPSSLGLLTGAYFIAFAAMQIPAGMLLDRYGPRRVEPVLLTVAGAGALAFAASDGIAGLALARALIGAGVSVCLMAPLKAIATWYSRERQASLAGWMMVAGGCGALLSTEPLAAALSFVSWRGIFAGLAVATFAAAAAIFFTVPDTPRPAQTEGSAGQWRGVRDVFRSPRFWWVSPLGAVAMGSFMAIQGLWSVPWLMEVNGYSREIAARHLLITGVAILSGYFLIGTFSTAFARRGVAPRHLFAAGFFLHTLMLALIVSGAPVATYLLWALYGLGSSVNILGYTVVTEGFAAELAGRANTALNLMMFVASFVAQWGIGIVVDLARRVTGADVGGALPYAFAVVLAADVLVCVWFASGWRRYAAVVHPAIA